MAYFIGNVEAKVDGKGRVFIPSAFRKVLQSRGTEHVVMKKDTDKNYLVVYPQAVWEEKLKSLQGRLNEWNSEERMALIQYVSDAVEMEIDSQGRVLIQKRWLEAIGAEDEVLFVGGIDDFTIWSKTEWEKEKLSKEKLKAILDA